MTHNLIGADRVTHLKIVVVALVAAIAVAAAGVGTRLADTGVGAQRAEARGAVLKAGKPAASAALGAAIIR